MKFQYEAVIAGTGSFLPKKNVTNKELFTRISGFNAQRALTALKKRNKDFPSSSAADEVFDAWVLQVCGIEERPFLSEGELEKGLEVESMAAHAAEAAIQAAEMNLEAIGHVVFSTYSSSRIMPSPACVLVKKLGLRQGLSLAGNGSEKGDTKTVLGCSALTVNGACSGFLDALIDAVIKIRCGMFEHVLVVAADYLSNKMNFSDPTSAIIFSDGAGALLLSRAKPEDTRPKILGFASAIEYSEQVYMENSGTIFFKGDSGPLVQRHAVNSMYNIGLAALESCGLSFADLQAVLPHQANSRIIEALRKKINQKDILVLNKIAKLGNLSSATVPVLLDLYMRKKIYAKTYARAQKLLLTSVGGGYTFSAVVTEA